MSALELIAWDAPGPYEVVFSTRAGGVSNGPYASLNVGLLTEDDPENVAENRRRLFSAAGADPERARWPRQVHGAAVLHADGRGAEADGLWTDAPGVALTVVTADCLPIALGRLDGERPAVALLHAGWRGLLAGVVAAGCTALGGRLAAVVGPGIGRCCYEVGDDVAAPLQSSFGSGLSAGGRLDLAAAAERALRQAGVTRVDRIDACTACNEARFFSHRRDRGLTGRQAAIARVA